MLVDNPAHHAHGDFALDADGLVHEAGEPRLTFSGIGVYRPGLLQDWRDIFFGKPVDPPAQPCFKLVPLLLAAMRRGQVSGVYHHGIWNDIGTPARLDALRAELSRAR